MNAAKEIAKPKRSIFRKIINVFIGIFLGFVLLVVIFIGYSQTKSFREYLRSFVMSEVNSSINGNLTIEKIDGTILTSIFLRNTLLTTSGDTLLYAKNIEIKTSPLQIFMSKIFFRKILLEDVKIKLLQNEEGAWNYSSLLKLTEEDTSKTDFPFLIQVSNLQFKNINLINQNYQFAGSDKIYPTVNFDDLRIINLYLSGQAILDIDNSDYLLILEELSFKPNLTRFTMQNISGDFALTNKFIDVKNFTFITDSSDIRLNARLDEINLFSNFSLEDFKNYPISIDLDASSFNFDDLSSFIGSTEILKGNPAVELKANGKFGSFKFEKLFIDYNTTHFEAIGEVRNLNIPDKLFIKAEIKNSDINYKDVNKLLPTLELPEFAKLSLTGANLFFEGEPTNFKSKFEGNVEQGFVKVDCSLNVGSSPMIYNIRFETNDLDLKPIIGVTTSLNSLGTLKGSGTSPTELNSEFNFQAVNSILENNPIENFSIVSNAKEGIINLDIDVKSNNATAFMTGKMIYDNDTIPTYSLIGQLNHIDLSELLNDENYNSDLNFYFSAEGKRTNLDDMIGVFSFGIDSSLYRDTRIKKSSIDIELKKEIGKREINIVSDFVDFNISGNFSINDAIDVIAYESKTIAKIISEKINELNPLSVLGGNTELYSGNESLPDIINTNLKFNYDFKFKDFALISELLGYERLDIIGSGIGSITNSPPHFSIDTKLDLNYFIFMQDGSTIYLSDVNTDLKFTRDNNEISFEKLLGKASLKGKRFYSTGNIRNILANFVFDKGVLQFKASAEIEELIKAEANGTILMTPVEQQIKFDKLAIDYNNIIWSNKDAVEIFFNPYRFNIANCKLYHDTSFVSIKGIIESSGDQNLVLQATNLSGRILGKYLFGIDDYEFKADADIKATISGGFDDPYINTSIKLNNLAYGRFKLGFLNGSIKYLNKKVISDIVFVDSTQNASKPLLTLSGTIPIDLSFESVENRFPETEEMNLRLFSKDFNVRTLTNLLPSISEQRGNLLTDLQISGNLDNPKYSGYFIIRDGYFKAKNTNLPYSCGLKVKFENEGMLIDSLIIANAGGTNYPGSLNGNGSIIFDGFNPKDMVIRFNGNLALFSDISKTTSPFLYGDLQIGTERDWLLTLRNNRLFLKGDVLIKESNLTLTTSEQTSLSNNNYNIVFVVDSSKIDKEILRFHEVIAIEQAKKDQSRLIKESQVNFDYELGVKIENSARINIILSQAVNQKLLVELRGELNYESISGDIRAQGAFELMSGSKLEFFKTFDAEGFIRFESDLTNPFLDVVATYKSDYIDPRSINAAPQEVAVKINIKGPLIELGKNLAANTESMGIYVGTRNIQNNVRETSYDYADAFSFILIGKFKDDLTAQDRAQVAGYTTAIGNTATSFLGSVLTSFLNSAVGDLVNNVQISQTGDFTKFSLSGRVQNLRYSFGGTTEVFQNFGKANIKIEYLFNPKFLIRLERKDPIAQTYILDDKINELALKYRFEF
jgi:hypothetical protein